MYIETDIRKTRCYQDIFAEGFAVGYAKGFALGFAKGQARAVARDSRKTLLSLYHRGLISKAVFDAEMQQVELNLV